jgi:peptidoglycan/LPS O-acetylase OafA/YrhL
MSKIANIQVMRGFAALAVTFFHIAGTQRKEGFDTWIFFPFRNWGSWGVDLFFIISGYVMAVSLGKNSQSSTRFLLKRFIRIYPLYFFLTVLFCLTSIIAPKLFSSFSLEFDWFMASLTMTSGVLGFGEPILGQGWTLEFEALFYILIAVVIYFKQSKRLELLTSLFLLGLCLFGVNTIILEFSFGMLLAKFRREVQKLHRYRLIIIWFGITTLLMQLIHGVETLPRFVSFGIPCLLIFLGFILITPTRSKVLLYLGEISYSIYLIQFFIIPACFKFFKVSTQSAFLGDIRGVSAVLLIIGSSHLTHKFIEVRCAIFLKRVFKLN